FAGDGNLAAPLRALAEELGVTPAVRFLGSVTDIYSEIRTWDLFTFATTENEGMGSAIAEAMMVGLPTVLTEIGPTADFAGDGERPAVRLVPPRDPQALADAICELIPNLEARRTLANDGLEYAMRRYHPAAFAREYARLLGLPAAGAAH